MYKRSSAAVDNRFGFNDDVDTDDEDTANLVDGENDTGFDDTEDDDAESRIGLFTNHSTFNAIDNETHLTFDTLGNNLITITSVTTHGNNEVIEFLNNLKPNIDPNEPAATDLQKIKSLIVSNFKNNLKTFDLSLKDGIDLGLYLIAVQEGTSPQTHYFDEVRTETNPLRYLAPNRGNTGSWYEIVGEFKKWLLEKVRIENRLNNLPIMAAITVELPAQEYDNLNKIFNLHRGHNLHNFLLFAPTNYAKEFNTQFKRQQEVQLQRSRALSSGSSSSDD